MSGEAFGESLLSFAPSPADENLVGRADRCFFGDSRRESQPWALEDVMMSKLSLKMKLGVGFGALLGLIVLLGFSSYYFAKQAAVRSSQVDDAVAMKDAAMDSSQAMWKGLAACRGFLLS